MRIETEAIVCALRAHSEHGAIVRLLTPAHGLQAVYVRGARGRRMRPILIAGNAVSARLSSRSESQLPQADVELAHSRAPLFREPLSAAAVEWATALTATALAEGHPYPQLYKGLDGLLSAIEAAPSAAGWGAALVRYELLLLSEMGFGLDLERCAVSNSPDRLVAVSPTSGKGRGEETAEPYGERLLPLPRFLREGGQGGWTEIADGLALTGHFLMRDILHDRSAVLGDARARLVERLHKAGGLA